VVQVDSRDDPPANPLASATESCTIAAAANLASRAPKLTASEVEKESFNEVWSLQPAVDPRENNADRLVTDIVGREFKHEFVGNLKPKPLLLLKALELSGCGADTALLVVDSVDDKKAGRRAKIRRRVGLLQHSTARGGNFAGQAPTSS
jgi:hypothetical protein